MPLPAVSNTLVDGTVITAGPLNTNFSDIIAGITDGTKDLTINNITTNGDVVLGATAADSLAVNGTITTSFHHGAKTPGWISNLGISLSAGVFSITDSAGAALSASSYGWVCVPSTTAGRSVVLKVTAGGVFNDDSHASSDLTGLGWGISETANWGNDSPFFLYVVNRGNTNLDGADGSSAFFLARHPCMNTTPSAAGNIGDTVTIPTTDDQTSILIMQTATVANYVSLPCQLIGAIRMRWASATTDWTVQALGNSDGLGDEQLRKTFAKTWTYPTGQNGAVASRFSTANGGTAPAWSTQTYFYQIYQNGNVRISAVFNGDGGTDGAGAVDFQLTIPYTTNTGHGGTVSEIIGVARVTGAGALTTIDFMALLIDATAVVAFEDESGTNLQNGEFSAGTRGFKLDAIYSAYVV